MDATTRIEGWVAAAMAQEWVWRLLVGLAIAVVGVYLARLVARLLDRLMLRLAVDDIMRNFLRNVAYAIAMVVVFIAALDFVGVPTTSLLAVVGAAGLAIGLALKDSLSNIASGVMLIVLRPFRAGDVVQVAGQEGVVDSVRIFQTLMHTADNRAIILPNSQITTAPIVNYTTRGDRRVDVSLPMAFGDDFAALREDLLAMARENPRVRDEPEPRVLVMALEQGIVTLQLRAWVPARDHANALAELNEAVLMRYAAKGSLAPLPRREVHVIHHGGDAEGAVLDEALRPQA